MRPGLRRSFASLALPALLCTLLLTVLAPARADLSQTAFPAKGGTLYVSAPSPGANYVDNASSEFELRDSNNDLGAASPVIYDWASSLQVPANRSQTDTVTYTVVLHAYYFYVVNGYLYSGYTDFAQGLITVAPDNVAPTVSNIAVSATAFPAKGGTLSVSADVTDANVDFTPDSYSYYQLLDVNGANGGIQSPNADWSANLQVPFNTSQTDTATYTLVLHTHDTLYNYWDTTLATITVAPDNMKPTSITVAPVSGLAPNTVTLTATLKETGAGTLSRQTLAFKVDGVAAGSAATNGSGVATVSYAILNGAAAGSHTITAAFARAVPYLASTGHGTLTVKAVQVASLSVSPGTVAGGNGATGTVTLTSNAPSGGTVVTLASSKTTAAAVLASVTVAAGQATATFPITTSAVNASTTVTLSAAAGGVKKTHTLTVTPKAPVLSSLTPSTRKAGSGAFVLTATGANFVPGSVIKWKGAAQATTFISSTQLTASIAASLTATTGTAAVTVSTPGVAASASKTFTITH